MNHWSDKYIGLAYEDSDFNCGHFVEKVLSEKFSIDIKLPCDMSGVRDQSESIANNLEKHALEIDHPMDGAGVLMKCRSLYHIGICVEINQFYYCIHNVKSFGSSMRHRLNDLEAFDLTLAGFYTWKAPQA